MPVVVNITILNGMGVSGELSEPVWKPGKNGDKLEIFFSYPELLWPWSGYLGLHMRVHPDAANWEGDVEGLVVFTVVSPPGPGETEPRSSTVELPGEHVSGIANSPVSESTCDSNSPKEQTPFMGSIPQFTLSEWVLP